MLPRSVGPVAACGGQEMTGRDSGASLSRSFGFSEDEVSGPAERRVLLALSIRWLVAVAAERFGGRSRALDSVRGVFWHHEHRIVTWRLIVSVSALEEVVGTKVSLIGAPVRVLQERTPQCHEERT